MKITANIINAFTHKDRGGNPAAVVRVANLLTADQKQQIARAMGLSETVFISKSEIADFRLDFHTPTKQIPNCGHATVAAFAHLIEWGIVADSLVSVESVGGIGQISIEDGIPFMEQSAPQFQDIETSYLQIALNEGLGLSFEDLIPNVLPLIGSTGNPFLIVGVRNRHILQKIIPNQKIIEKLSNEKNLIGFYVFSLDVREPGHHATTRMFAPAYGILEEAATGMAAGPLAGYCYEKLELKRDTFLIEQGNYMIPESPSLIIAQPVLGSGKIKQIWVGGQAQLQEVVDLSI